MNRILHRLVFSLVMAATVALPVSAETAGKTEMPRLAVQLWSVKEVLQEDFEGTLKAIAGMGFEGVEFARYFGPYENDAAGLKTFLDSIGLEAMGAHIGFENLNSENFDQTVAFYDVLNTRLLTVAMDHRAFDPEQVDDVVSDLNLLSRELAPRGMFMGYHNHHQEFAAFGEDTFWDHIARNTSAEVVLQLDVGNMQAAHADPVTYVRRYPGRTISTHYKATLPPGSEGLLPIIGQDSIDWSALIAANLEVGGTRWFIVEQEEYPNGMTELEAVEASLRGLKPYLHEQLMESEQ